MEYGSGSAAEVGAWATGPKAPRILVLTHSGRWPGVWIDRLALPGKVTVFDAVQPEPDTDNLALALGAAHAAPPDLVVGLGGGSVLDVAQAGHSGHVRRRRRWPT